MKNPINGLKDKASTLRTGMSRMSRSMLYTLTGIMSVVFVCSLLWGLRSCSGEDYDFTTNDEAIAFYRDYLHQMRNRESADSRSFCKELNKWTEVKDTIARFLCKDPDFTSESAQFGRFMDVNDSIKEEFARLTETWKCSFNDVILIKEGTSPFRDDSEIITASQDADSLFRSLDGIKILPKTKEMAIEEYRSLLADTEHIGIHTWEDVVRFLTNEDLCFRAFLEHLYELDDDHISDITESTERICRGIFLSARNGEIDKKKVVTYMSMRTVRRLLQNSTVCINDISSKKLKSDVQANAYLWMIIQPFMSIDQLAIVTITPEGRQNIRYIADRLPKSSSFAKAFNIDQRSLSYLLPQQLLRMYIYSL